MWPAPTTWRAGEIAVTLVEKGEVCSGCSYGNAGLLVPSHSIPLAAPGVVAQGLKWMGRPDSPFYIRPRIDAQLIRWLWRFYRSANHRHVRRSVPLLRDLSFASLELYDELDRIEGFDFDLVRNGYLQVGKESYSKEDAEVRILNEAGVAANVLTPEETRELVPETELEIGGAIHFPQDWNLSPHRFVTGLAAQAAALGADIRTGAEVLGFERNGSRVSLVKTTRGDFSPGEIVLAAGSWSPVCCPRPLPVPADPGGQGVQHHLQTPAPGGRRSRYLPCRGQGGGVVDGGVPAVRRHPRAVRAHPLPRSCTGGRHPQGGSRIHARPRPRKAGDGRDLARHAALHPGRPAPARTPAKPRQSHGGGRPRHGRGLPGAHNRQTRQRDRLRRGAGDRPRPDPSGAVRLMAGKARLQEMKRAGRKITVLTCYDYPTALWEEEAGVDVVFVGDSVGTNVLGYASETEVTMEDMAHHLKAVRRGVEEAYLLVDLPFGSADTPEQAVENGLRLASLGADGVKLEGFKPEAVRALSAEGLDVWGHLGLLPQFQKERALQAKTAESAAELLSRSIELERAGSGFPRSGGGAGGGGRGGYPAPGHPDDRHRRGPRHRRPGDRRFRPARRLRPRAAPRRPPRRQQGGRGARHQGLCRRGCGKGAFRRKGTCAT